MKVGNISGSAYQERFVLKIPDNVTAGNYHVAVMVEDASGKESEAEGVYDIVVINKNDLFTFDRFVDRIQNKNIHELKIQENFSEFIGQNVEDDNISMDDTSTLLNSYVDNVETELDKDRIKKEMHDLMIEAQTLEIA